MWPHPPGIPCPALLDRTLSPLTGTLLRDSKIIVGHLPWLTCYAATARTKSYRPQSFAVFCLVTPSYFCKSRDIFSIWGIVIKATCK